MNNHGKLKESIGALLLKWSRRIDSLHEQSYKLLSTGSLEGSCRLDCRANALMEAMEELQGIANG